MPQPPTQAGDQPVPAASPDMAITAAATMAFSLGWQMARLYESPKGSQEEPRLEGDLPGLSELPAKPLTDLGLAQADVALKQIRDFLGVEAQLPNTSKIRETIATDQHDEIAIREAILALHIELLVDLTAADFRVGKSYGLGRALADTCAPARGTPDERRKSLAHHLEPHRALVLVGWLDDLKTALPAHSGQAVADSLERWVRWARDADLPALDANEISRTTHLLHRQGQRWRAIVSGEKDAKDLLTIGDYLTAARGTLRRSGQIVLSFARQLWAPLLVAGLLLGVGIALMFINNSTGQVLAGLGSVAGALGITWRSARTSLGQLPLRVGEPLWGAELDAVTAARLTPVPQRDNTAPVEAPRGRIRRAWRELRTRDDKSGEESQPLLTGERPPSSSEGADPTDSGIDPTAEADKNEHSVQRDQPPA